MESAENEIIEEIERKRRSAGCTQAQVAAACGMTQGHYSKVVSRTATLTAEAAEAFKNWTPDPVQRKPARPTTHELRRIATNLRREITRIEAMLQPER